MLIYKTARVCWYNPPDFMRFSQLVPWKHESVGRVLSEHQLGKPSEVLWIVSHKGSLYLLYTQPEISFSYCIIALKRCDMRYVI